MRSGASCQRATRLKNNLSRYLSHVKRGGEVRVFDRNRAVAEIVPIGYVMRSGTSELDGILDDLERKGVVRRGTEVEMVPLSIGG